MARNRGRIRISLQGLTDGLGRAASYFARQRAIRRHISAWNPADPFIHTKGERGWTHTVFFFFFMGWAAGGVGIGVFAGVGAGGLM